MSAAILTTHAVVHLSIEAPDSKTLPVIVELDNPDSSRISLNAAQYARYLQREGSYSYSSIAKRVVAIGKLRDYYLIVKNGQTLASGELRGLLEDFLHDFDHGNVLGWRPASNHVYVQTRSAIYEYISWLAGNSTAISSMSEARFLETCREAYRSTSYAEKSLLFHTKKRAKKKRRGRKKIAAGLLRYKPFPPQLVQELINCTKNPRDKLIFAILAYGGPRASEILHLFLEDVQTVGDQILIELRHPTMAPMTWSNVSGQLRKGQRRMYLKEVFGLLARTEHGSLASAAGWKGIKFDNQVELRAELYWIRDAGKYISNLHRMYLHSMRALPFNRTHPYYLINNNGDPLTLKALDKQFQLARRRIEKKFNVNLKGYGLHSMRHFYGFYCTDVLKMPLLLTQKFMHHTDPSSTAIYSHISPQTARKALESAERKNKGALPTKEEREQISDQFLSTSFQDLDELLAKGSTPFGRLDIKRTQRQLK